MQVLKNTAAELVSIAATELFAPAVLSADEVCAMLEYPPDGAMGDLALPCFKLSKSLRRSPMEIASRLSERISHPPSLLSRRWADTSTLKRTPPLSLLAW